MAETGTWFHPNGSRVEIVQGADGMYRIDVFLTRKSRAGNVGNASVNPAELAEKIAVFEQHGYVRAES